jgi:membrane protease YdiL (CAAX protease family)
VLATAAIVLFSLLALLALHEHELGVAGEEIPATLSGLIAGGLASASGFAVTLLAVVRPLDPALIRFRPGRETRLTLATVIVGTLTLSQALDSVLALLGLDAMGTPALIRQVLAGAAGPQLFVAVIVLGILVGTAEEAFFRGYMQTALRARWPPWGAVVGTSLAFALLHVDWVSLEIVHASLVLTLGLWLGFATERLDSALPAVAAHVLNNIVFTLEAASGFAVKGTGPNLLVGVACALVFAGCVVGLARVPGAKAVC